MYLNIKILKTFSALCFKDKRRKTWNFINTTRARAILLLFKVTKELFFIAALNCTRTFLLAFKHISISLSVQRMYSSSIIKSRLAYRVYQYQFSKIFKTLLFGSFNLIVLKNTDVIEHFCLQIQHIKN